MLARRPDDRHDVGLDLVGHADRAHEVADGEQPVPVDDGLDRVERVRGVLVAAGDPALAVVVRVADPGPEQEPVQLGLRQGERPLELDGVLRRQDEERVRQGGGSCPRSVTWRSCIASSRADWVRGVARLISSTSRMLVNTGPGDEAQAAGLEQAGAGHVRRQQVGRALDAGHPQVQRAGDGAGEQRLAGAGHVLEQHVAVGEQRDRDQADRLLGADDRPRDGVAQVVPQSAPGGDDVGTGGRASGAGRALDSGPLAAGSASMADGSCLVAGSRSQRSLPPGAAGGFRGRRHRPATRPDR